MILFKHYLAEHEGCKEKPFTFVATPRTGSRYVSKILELAGGTPSEQHHEHPADVPRDFPIYAVLRDPYDQALSWFYHAIVRSLKRLPRSVDFQRFLTDSYISFYFNTSLNPYSKITTKFFLYEKDLFPVVKRILTATVGPNNSVLTLSSDASTVKPLGKTKNVDRGLLTPLNRRLIEERFSEDIRLYERICGEQVV
jgi:hypothetical protein